MNFAMGGLMVAWSVLHLGLGPGVGTWWYVLGAVVGAAILGYAWEDRREKRKDGAK